MAVKAVEERVTVVERQVAENARGIEGLCEAVVDLGRRMDRGFEATERRFEAIDQRFEAIDRRFEAVDQRFEAMERRFDRMEQRVEQRLDRLDQQMSRQFFWVVGIQITTVLAMTGAIAAISRRRARALTGVGVLLAALRCPAPPAAPRGGRWRALLPTLLPPATSRGPTGKLSRKKKG